jgi:hypothetical protein
MTLSDVATTLSETRARVRHALSPPRASFAWYLREMPDDGPFASALTLARFSWALDNHAAIEGADVPEVVR